MLSLKKYDLKTARWSEETNAAPVVYRKTLLGAMYPDLDIAIGNVSGYIENEDYSGAIAALDVGFEGYQIVGASGSRKKGNALFVRGKDTNCFSRFFGNPSNCVNYGSNLVTECKEIFEFDTGGSILIVPDGQFGTGDCHGKCSKEFALHVTGQLQRPFQFRAAVKAKHSWVAKGTIAFSFDTGGYDLVLPESCFKGNKVKPGVYTPKTLYFGIVHEAEVRHVKMSYSVTQYLPWEVIEKDILPGTITQAQKLVSLQSNTRELAEYLLRTGNDCECEEDTEEESEYVNPLAEIVSADIHNQLIDHPYVVRKVKDMLRKRWLKLATAGAVQFQSCMTIPDDSISSDEVCIPHLPEGDVIVFPYPCRWKYDIKIWHNRHVKKWMGYEGIIVGNHVTMLTVGRDFDGDFLQVLPASTLPNVAAAVRKFDDMPSVHKPKKEKIEGSLGEIAVRSMDNCVGLITFAIAKAWACDRHDYIPWLAQQLQIEVDSLKNVQRADREYIKDTLEAMRDYKVSWLYDHKEADVFITRPIAATGNDTISRLCSAINAIWRCRPIHERSLIEFRDLFPTSKDSWKEKAGVRLGQFRAELKAALKSGDRRFIIAVYERFKDMVANISEDKKMEAAAAFWHVAHTSKSGTASMIIHGFTDCIKERLSEQRFAKLTIVGSKYGDFSGYTWQGDETILTIGSVAEGRFVGRLEARIGDNLLGLLAADSAKYPVGTQLTCKLTTDRGSVIAVVA